MKLLALPIALIVLLLCAACGRSHSPSTVTNPIPLPEIPAKYVSETIVVPDELQEEFTVLLAWPYQDYWSLDLTTLSGEERRAAVYWRFARRPAVGNGFTLHVDATDRSAAEDFVQRLAAGWGMDIGDSYYTAVNHRAHYELWHSAEPRWTLGETAWLNEWLLLNYPQFYIDCSPDFQYAHSEGAGESI